MPERILVTGATGFVGKKLVEKLSESYALRIVTRRSIQSFQNKTNIEWVKISDISHCDWHPLLQEVDYVVHCAGMAHQSNIKAKEELWRTNVYATARLAEACAQLKIKRFIFMSSIKVLGEETLSVPFNHLSSPNPQDLYGKSKWAAEKKIHQLQDLNWVVLRPTLIYSVHPKGNLKLLLKLIKLNIPLPFKKINNQRSIISLDNLIDYIMLCLSLPQLRHQTFLCADKKPLSTFDIIELIAADHKLKARVFYCPKKVIMFFAKLLGLQNTIKKMTSSLVVDASYTNNFLKK